jgi:hypothetical protein
VRIEVRDESSRQERNAAKRKKQKTFLAKKKPKKSVDSTSRLIEALVDISYLSQSKIQTSSNPESSQPFDSEFPY